MHINRLYILIISLSFWAIFSHNFCNFTAFSVSTDNEIINPKCKQFALSIFMICHRSCRCLLSCPVLSTLPRSVTRCPRCWRSCHKVHEYAIKVSQCDLQLNQMHLTKSNMRLISCRMSREREKIVAQNENTQIFRQIIMLQTDFVIKTIVNKSSYEVCKI